MPRTDTSESMVICWLGLALIIPMLDWILEVVLLKRQLNISRCNAVPCILKSTVTPDDFLWSASRFETFYKSRIAYKSVCLVGTLSMILCGYPATVWNWSSYVVQKDLPHASFWQSIVWLAMLHLSRIALLTIAQICISPRGLFVRPQQSHVSYLNCLVSIASVSCVLGVYTGGNMIESLSSVLESKSITMIESTISTLIPVLVFTASVYAGPSLLSVRNNHTLSCVSPSSFACSGNQEKPARSASRSLSPSHGKVFSQEESKALSQYHDACRGIRWRPHAVVLLNVLFVMIFIQLITPNPVILAVAGFHLKSLSSETPTLVLAGVVGSWFLRPLTVITVLQRNFFSRRDVIAQDSEKQEDYTNDWVDYESCEIVSSQDVQAHLRSALLSIYLARDIPLFSDALYSAYYLTEPTLTKRFATLHAPTSSYQYETDGAVAQPAVSPTYRYSFESDSDIAVPSIMLLA